MMIEVNGNGADKKLTVHQAAQAARLIVERCRVGALATHRLSSDSTDFDNVQDGSGGFGHPYVSKVGVATDLDGAPLFLLSTLAAHTQDLLIDSRASLLVDDLESADNPLQVARTTLVGRVVRVVGKDEPARRERYLKCHENARQYADFGDFSVWRMTVEKVHYVGGFGLSKWMRAVDYLT